MRLPSHFSPVWAFWMTSTHEFSLWCFPIREALANVRLSFLVAIFLAIDLILILTWVIFIYPYFFSPLRHLPRPKGELPLIGQALRPYRRPLGSTFLKWMVEVPNDGLITYRSFLNQDRVVVTSPKAIADVLMHNPYHYTKQPQERSVIRRFLGDGLTIVEGNDHRFQRKRMTPIYAVRNIKQLYPVFWKKAVKLTERLGTLIAENGGGCDVQEINQWANKSTMDIIGLAALGQEFSCLDGIQSELFDTYQEIFSWAPEKDIFMALNRCLPERLIQSLPWRVNERIDVTTTTLRNICRTLISDRLKDPKAISSGKGDLISRMVESGGWSEEQLVEQLLTIIAAGHETSASAFTWACYLLCRNQAAQARLYEELRREVPFLFSSVPHSTPDSHTLSTHLDTLPYLNAVCNEVLRFIPPVPLIRRYSIVPTTILDHPIPAGTQVLLCPFAINRSPLLWGPNAGEFKPERWINPETGKANNDGGMDSNYANLTFSHGPRSCIGQNFARAELRALVAAFVHEFRFELSRPHEDVVPVGIVSVRPKDGLYLRIEKRPVEEKECLGGRRTSM